MSHEHDLEDARQRSRVMINDLWIRYFALGGMRTPFELEAIRYGLLVPSDLDRDHVVLAIDERFSALGIGPPLPYSDE